MNLQQFVKMLPKHLVYAPIYRKGVEIKSKEGKILEATGKNLMVNPMKETSLQMMLLMY